jgi:hypothetical protein
VIFMATIVPFVSMNSTRGAREGHKGRKAARKALGAPAHWPKRSHARSAFAAERRGNANNSSDSDYRGAAVGNGRRRRPREQGCIAAAASLGDVSELAPTILGELSFRRSFPELQKERPGPGDRLFLSKAKNRENRDDFCAVRR